MQLWPEHLYPVPLPLLVECEPAAPVPHIRFRLEKNSKAKELRAGVPALMPISCEIVARSAGTKHGFSREGVALSGDDLHRPGRATAELVQRDGFAD